jgi:hypothetical protein
MGPDALLSILVRAHQQLLADPDTPFLMPPSNQAPLALTHPMLPGGGLPIDATTRDALVTLVQWGYLTQPEQYHGLGYVLTPAAMNYAARKDGSVSAGTEQQQRQRRRSGRG